MIEQYGSDAFRHEYERNIPPNALRKDIESYLGEYRFQVPTYEYDLEFSADETGAFALRDVDKKEPIKNMAQKAIDRRWSEGKPILRESAELAGIESFEKQLHELPNDSSIVWMSPPGAKEDGYGNYGFVYVGTVLDSQDKRMIKMKAMRVENPSVSQFNVALKKLTGTQISFISSEGFLGHPVGVQARIDNAESILTSTFDFKMDSEKEEIFREVLIDITPNINEFIELVKQGVSKKELVQTFKSLENYALDLRAYYQSHTSKENLIYIRKPNSADIMIMRYMYGYEPPDVLGSCGSTGESSNIFSKYGSLSKLFSNNEETDFNCPKCKKSSPTPVGDSCPKCGYTKEQAQKDGRKVC